MAGKRLYTVRSPRLTFRKRPKTPVKNVPIPVRPTKADIVLVYADEILDHVFVEPTNDNDRRYRSLK